MSTGEQCVEINIIDDDLVETTEQFQVNLFFVNNPNLILDGPSTKLITIQDNDGTGKNDCESQ